MPQGRYHFSYPRDGGPVPCDCELHHDHDAESLTHAEARREADRLIATFYRDLGYVAPEMYELKFTELSESIQSVITRTGA